MKITDLKVAIIGNAPIVRITTDEGIDGVGAAEYWKPYLKPMIEFYRDMIVGKDPTDVERVMLVQAMGCGRQRNRDGSVGHRRKISRSPRVQIARWQDSGQSSGLQR